MNRKGLVCSECVEGFGLSVTFFGFSCSKCTNSWYGIIVYLLLEFVPITVFYFLILIFRVGLTSSPFTAFVLFSQFTVASFAAGIGPYSFETNPAGHGLTIIITFYGFWNLDFFRYLIPPFCVSPTLKVIHIVFLGYISAFYPLLLVCITLLYIELYSRNLKIFVWTWNKLNRCLLKHVNRESNSTIIDVFSTFLLLSLSKIVVIFVMAMEPDFIQNMNYLPRKSVLLSDPSIEWMGSENIPYVTVSMFFFVVLILPPVALLLFYQSKKFRYLLLKCSSCGHARAALNIFVEKFYDSYRDGLKNGRDMRGFSSLYFLLRIVVFFLTIAEEYLLYNALVLGGTAILIALVQPYKKTYMNVIDTLILAISSFNLVMFDLYFRESLSSKIASFYVLIFVILGSLPMWGFLGYVAYKVIPFNRILQHKKGRQISHCLKFSIRTFIKKDKNNERVNDQRIHVNEHAEGDVDLPDRIMNPENYGVDLSSSANYHGDVCDPNTV